VEIALRKKNKTVMDEVSTPITILFQGDSITESGRCRRNDADMGTGYAMIVAKRFSAEYAGKQVRFLNRGVSGDKVKDLRKRWQKDCLDLRPDVVSILIGINDIVGKYFWNNPTSTKSFEEDYRTILEQTHDVLAAKIILLTPFVIHISKTELIHKIILKQKGELANYVSKIELTNKAILKQKIGVVNKLSKEFGTLLIPLDSIFDEATKKRTPTYLSTDGIHLTAKGHSLIAQSWLKSVSAILT
jgi:lysophospholipase L1-like esterase